MQICKKYFLCLLTALFVFSILVSQSVSSPQAPSIPTVTTPAITPPTAPTVPSVTVPSFTPPASPSMPTPPIVTPPEVFVQTTPAAATSNKNSQNETSTVQTTNTQNNQTSNIMTSSLASDLNATAIETITNLFSNDSSNLGQSPLGSLSSLGDLSTILNTTPTGETSSVAISTNALLQEVLAKLGELEKKIDKGSIESRSQAETSIKNQSQILRFLAANGSSFQTQNILTSVKNTFISTPEKDGTFLLSCDRIYTTGNVTFQETIYMLFKASGSDTFEVALSVQGKDSNSVLKQLSKSSPFKATRTGNLVTIHLYNQTQQLEVLLDINFE